ncbi:MAG: LamG domain-containing protein, partial [Sedimentisphaerales bacterium]|nr:LamG domain-containing protein [Sedimentisphaerales bacterium]
MSRKLILPLSVLVALVAGSTRAELIAYYPFSEGQGTSTVDATGNGNDGTFDGDVEWVAGYKGGAVRFDTGGERIVIGPLDPSAGTDAMTLAAWINWEGSGSSIAHQGIIGKRLGWDDGDTIKWFWETGPTGDLVFRADYSGGGANLGFGNAVLASYANEWAHVALTWDDGDTLQYINGEEVSSGNVTFREAASATPVTIGCVDSTNTETFIGIIDEVQFYSAALTAAELQDAMTAEFSATSSSSPFPPDTATDVRRDVVLSWMPGAYAETHDVYFGTLFDDVNSADAGSPLLVGPGQDATTYDPPGLLDFGQTYYWRVDEANGAPDFTVYPGAVWSFTTEPFYYTVGGVVASASLPTAEGSGGPEVTVDGTGLTDGLHGTGDATMWSGKAAAGDPVWLQYDFDRVYKLYQMHVWNYNGLYEMWLGFGLKDVTIEYATEPNEWMTLGDYEFDKATSLPTYAGQVIELDGLPACSIRINVHSNRSFQGELQYGLSEIRFLYKPVSAQEPQPADGETGVGINTTLSWRAGREAVSHQVHFGTDSNAVAEGTALLDTV